jgi:hypothetical protein
MTELAQAEDKIFQKRQRNELMFRQRNRDKKENERLTKIEDYTRDNQVRIFLVSLQLYISNLESKRNISF